jgi:RND superfamily putative drug exporter
MSMIVAAGVLLDTFVVRTLLVPTLAIDVGPAFWWPSRRAHEAVAPPPVQAPVRVPG